MFRSEVEKATWNLTEVGLPRVDLASWDLDLLTNFVFGIRSNIGRVIVSIEDFGWVAFFREGDRYATAEASVQEPRSFSLLVPPQASEAFPRAFAVSRLKH